LPRLLASNADQHWLVTELFERGTLEKNIGLFYAMPEKAVRAFRSLVAAVASLHADGYVHRDIKPPNIFVQHDDELVLGDFGIVYMPSLGERVTQTNERVGPRDYMPQWADLGERQESVLPNFDVYMLGKVLWCMISGRLKLPREYHRRTEYDLTVKFPNDPRMHLINLLLDACVVEEPAKCLKSAVDLLQKVDECISLLSRNLGIFVSDGKVLMPCRMCGKGTYKQEMPGAAIVVDSHDDSNRHLGNARLRPFICTVCTHREFFSPNFPEEAHRKGWKPW
jgi:serine/threonine protein kinase